MVQLVQWSSFVSLHLTQKSTLFWNPDCKFHILIDIGQSCWLSFTYNFQSSHYRTPKFVLNRPSITSCFFNLRVSDAYGKSGESKRKISSHTSIQALAISWLHYCYSFLYDPSAFPSNYAYLLPFEMHFLWRYGCCQESTPVCSSTRFPIISSTVIRMFISSTITSSHSFHRRSFHRR